MKQFNTKGKYSPRDFVVSPRLNPEIFENDTILQLSEEEQNILFQIQDIQSQLSALRANKHKSSPNDSNSHQKHKQHIGRLIMVSNRLPISISKDAQGEWIFELSSGGLVTALSGLKKDIPFLWVGWPGIHVPTDDQEHLAQRLVNELGLYPVFLSEKLVEDYYNGFCNDILWPLFHYSPLPHFEPGRQLRFDLELFDAYKEANQLFANALFQAYQEGDLVWVHDYHLMLMPKIIRKQLPTARIGWFLHTPFPASDVYRILPVRDEILKGILMADLLGFHTYDYARHFLSSSTRCLGLETGSKGVYLKGHFCTVGVFPIGIDPLVFEECLNRESTQNRLAELRETFKGKKVLIGVDRLDYIKGVPHKLSALETFLTRYPQWRGKVVLIQIAVPSRTSVIQYKLLCSEVNEMVGRINGSFGSFDYSPVHYLFTSVPLPELCALYALADACLITSIRDGMNLVSYEYVLCQEENCGVLVISEFAGAARSLGTAIRINPWDSEEVADAIHRALSLPIAERKLKHSQLDRYVRMNTASAWGKGFVEDLIECGQQNIENFSRILRPKQLLEYYSQSENRMILADFRGILAVESGVPSKETCDLVKSLSESSNTHLVIFSEASRKNLDTWFHDMDLTIFSEDGAYVRWGCQQPWQCLVPEKLEGWHSKLMPIFTEYSEQLPGISVESTENSMSWVSKGVDPDFGIWQATQIQQALEDEIDRLDLLVEVVSSHGLVKVRPIGTSKGCLINFVFEKYSKENFDFVFCIGNDSTDEDMFVNCKAQSSNSITCRVCNTSSQADYFVPTSNDAMSLLRGLIQS